MKGGLDDTGALYGNTNTALSASLKNGGSTLLPKLKNQMCTGPRTGSKDILVAAITDPSNWIGSNTVVTDKAAAGMPFTFIQKMTAMSWITFYSVSVVYSHY